MQVGPVAWANCAPILMSLGARQVSLVSGHLVYHMQWQITLFFYKLANVLNKMIDYWWA